MNASTSWKALTLVGLLVGVAVPRSARGQCTVWCDTGASPSYCNYNCPSTTSDYLVFGVVWEESAPGSGWFLNKGVGVCRFTVTGYYGKGTYLDYVATTTNVVDYRVRADSANVVRGGNDAVRLARPVFGEVCRQGDATHTHINVIGGPFGSGDTFLFWGDIGNDWIQLCWYWTGYFSECVTNAGRADGRDGNDQVYGSAYTDRLWGGPDSGNDWIYGWDGDDFIYGGYGDDHLYGGDGGDYAIYGEAGLDIMYGGPGWDVMNGGSERDVIWGEGGEDNIVGGSGNDELHGGVDPDYLWGDEPCGPNTGIDDCWCEEPGLPSGPCADATCDNPQNCSGTCPCGAAASGPGLPPDRSDSEGPDAGTGGPDAE